MNRWPVILAILLPVALIAAISLRVWIYGDAGLEKPDGDLSDPNDLTLTKLRLDEPVKQGDRQIPL